VTARSIRAVIFDMDGVLCDSEPFINEAAIGVLRDRYGIVTEPAEYLPFTGTGDARYITAVAREHGLELEPERAKAELYERYLATIRGRLQPTPGAREFVAACRDAGLGTALASSADAVKVDANLAEIGIDLAAFDVIVSGQDVTRRKPAPDIFLLAAERLRVPPGSCLVIEDALTGVRAAKAAGMRCLALTTSFGADQLAGAGADVVAADFTDVPAGLWDDVDGVLVALGST
jgi:HAD superfamily hydrolase (TIGR01509 family)